VIYGPTIRFLGHPGPAGVCVNPAAIIVRPPILGDVAWLPDVPIVGSFNPITVLTERVIEEVDGYLGRGSSSASRTNEEGGCQCR
jgi:hypothetical protein